MSDSVRGNQLKLIVGLAVIAAIVLAQGVIGSLLTQASDARAQTVYRSSLASLNVVFRIASDVDRTRILVDEHIFAADAAGRAASERELAGVDADLNRAERVYAPFIGLPGEAGIWREVQDLLDRFQTDVSETVALSRRNEDIQAYARVTLSERDYDALHDKLDQLIHINQTGADDAMTRIATLHRNAEWGQWFTRIVGLLLLLVFGRWGIHRIARYESQIAEHVQSLERRNRDLDAFAGRVAHDLKNALGPIGLSAGALRSAADDPRRVMAIAEKTQRWSQRVASVIDSLLAFSRSGQRAASEESAALAPVVKNVLEELGPLIGQLDATVEVSDLPDLRVRCDPGLLHVVLANLCGNAVKFLDGRSQRRVRIAAFEDDASCRIEISDTGPGIPPDARNKIFEPFYRVQGTRSAGTGIGLATVQRVVVARGGRVTVDSSEGRGSTFLVWLPLAQAAEAGVRAPGAEAAGRIAHSSRSS